MASSVPQEPTHAESSNGGARTNSTPSGNAMPLKSRPSHKVKFSMGCDDDDDAETMEQQEQLPSSTASSQSLPRVQIAFTSAGDESEDVSNLTDVNLKNPDWSGRTQVAALHARANANRLASRLTRSAPGSRRNSVTSLQESPEIESVSPTWGAPRRTENEDIPMMDLESQIHEERPYSFYESENDSDVEQKPLRRRRDEFHEEASRLIRSFTRQFDHDNPSVERTHRSGTETPAIDQQLHDLDYVPPPKDHKPGITAWLLKLHDVQGAGAAIGRHSFAPDASELGTRKQRPRMRGKSVSSDTMPLSDSHSETPGSSGKVTPLRKQKWYDDKASTRKSPPHSRIQSRTQSTSSLAQLLQSSTSAAIPGLPSALPAQSERPGLPRSRSSGMIATAVERLSHPSHAFKRSSMADEFHITVHIGDILARRQYLITLCRALMMYGAPTHRLEEYLQSSARVLQIDGQFLYIPGCMIMSFDDHVTHTAEVQLVRQKEGVDLGKFQDTFYVYKNTVHDKTNLEDATNELKEIIKRPNKIKTWIRVLLYGVASVSVGPFAFGLRPIDFPIAFLLGCLLGWLQLVVAPRSNQFQHVFEVAAAVLTSFIARALGSIHYNGKELFCFSALAQSSIALILPGYIILCASLELQSRNIVAGSVRMVYAIIYTLFLGFGITIGTALFGFMDPRGATSSVTCESPAYWKNTYLTHFPFVPIFTMCLSAINQAKWSQYPAMLIISFAGYLVNFFSSRKLANNVQVANALGAFVIGALANLYSRRFHGLAAAAMLPAIFVQVPSGLAASGSLVAGLTSANQITGNATGISVVNNGTAGFQDTRDLYGGTIAALGLGMVQVAIGISAGLFLSALVVYPFGKRRSGLFSF